MEQKNLHRDTVQNTHRWCAEPENAPRRLPSWHLPVLRPPFDALSGVVYAEGRHGSKRAKAAVYVRLRLDGVTSQGDGVTSQGDGVQASALHTPVHFSLSSAAAITLDWVEMDLPQTDVLLLFAAQIAGSRQGRIERLSPAGWRVMGSNLRWSTMPFDTAQDGTAMGVFRTRAVRDTAPAWFWHYMGGSLLADTTKEIRA
jgi:hypothetical protein